MERKKELLYRLYLVLAFFIVLSIVIVGRVFKVAILEGDEWRSKGNVNLKMMPLYAERGNIYSEELNLLSTSLQFFEIHMDLTVVNDKVFKRDVDSLAYYLSRGVGKHKSQSEWKSGLLNARHNKKRYYRIARRISIDEYNELKDYPIFRLGRFRGGLIAEKFGKRVKPFDDLASRTIGVDRAEHKVGLEYTYDKVLTGEERQVLMKRVSTVNDIWVPVYDVEEISNVRGNDIVATINVGIQDIVHEELKSRLTELDAEKGVAIVMDVETGAIKAMSNLSRYKDGYAEIRNLAVAYRTDPGSTMKLASTMALLDDGYCDLSTKVNLNGGAVRIYDRVLRDSRMHGIFESNLEEAFVKSSNVGIGLLANEHYNSPKGHKQFVNKLKQFGIGETVQSDITGEPAPVIKNPDKDYFSGVTIPWMSHGYEMQMSPLQILTFYNAVANNGRMMKPYLVSDIIDDTRTIKHFDPKVVIDQIAKSTTIRDAQKLLKLVVEEGTGKELQSDIVDISGKTGTARVNYTEKDADKIYNASFAGYFPSLSPKYSMIVIIYNPKGKVYGSSAAGPAFKNMAERISILTDKIARYQEPLAMVESSLPEFNAGYSSDFRKVFDYIGLDYKVKKQARWVEVDPYEHQMLIDRKNIKKSLVPNVKGMGARDAIYVLENLGLHVGVEGVGKVKSQSISPGEKVNGQNIKIYLN